MFVFNGMEGSGEPYIQVLKEFTSKKPNVKVVAVRFARGNGKPNRSLERLMDLSKDGARFVYLDETKN